MYEILCIYFFGGLCKMQIERGKDIENFQLFSDDLVVRIVREREMEPYMSSDVLGVNCIEHRVSRMDTLAGIAIKYGVEVADIKRLNGLMTDLQMFAHKSLQIPLPGRHPPSSVSPRGHCPEQALNHGPQIDLWTSFQSLKVNSPPQVVSPQQVSPAMSSLQGYYGLTSPPNEGAAEGTEKAVYRRGTAQYLEDVPQHKTSPFSDPPPSQHRRSRSLVNCFLPEAGGLAEDVLFAAAGGSEAQKSNEKLERRRWKADADADAACRTPELLLKHDSSSGFSGISGKSLALRPKSVTRAAPSADTDLGRMNPIPMGNNFMPEGFSGFRKSSSALNLQEPENSSSLWSTSKWTKKSDLQAASNGSTSRPIFDGLPKPMTIRKNKAAMD